MKIIFCRVWIYLLLHLCYKSNLFYILQSVFIVNIPDVCRIFINCMNSYIFNREMLVYDSAGPNKYCIHSGIIKNILKIKPTVKE